MITNREIESEQLLDAVLDEVVTSARAHGISDEELTVVFRERATQLEQESRSADGASDGTVEEAAEE